MNVDNIHQFPDRQAIEEEAITWLIKLDGDDSLSADELTSLKEWMQRSPVHNDELRSLAVFWSDHILTELAVPLGKPARPQASGLFARLFAPLAELNRLWKTLPLLGVLMITVWSFTSTHMGQTSSNGFYSTAVGQQQSTTLADGSIVQLNTNTQIEIEYTHQSRNIRLLQGEAHFTVAKDKQRPFNVFAGEGRIQAIGTAFSVYLKDEGIDITVTEGLVELASFQNRMPGKNHIAGTSSEAFAKKLGSLSAGQSTIIRHLDSQNPVVQTQLDPIKTIDQKELNSRLSWRRGLLTFTGEPLYTVVAEISRYTTLDIEIVDPQVRAIKIGGQFPAGETEVMLEVLENNFGLKVTRLGYGRVRLTAASD